MLNLEQIVNVKIQLLNSIQYKSEHLFWVLGAIHQGIAHFFWVKIFESKSTPNYF